MIKTRAIVGLLLIICASSVYGQEADSSCGTRTTYFIAKYYDRAPSSLEATSQLIGVSSDGISSLLGIHDGLAELGVVTEARRLSLEELAKSRELCIVTIRTDEGPHFMVFTSASVRNGVISLLDPPQTVEMSRDEFAQKWNGVALLVTSISGKSARQAPPTTEPSGRLPDADKGKGTAGLPARSATAMPQATTIPAAVVERPSWVLGASVAEKNFGRVILPTTRPLQATFSIENRSDHLIEIDRLVPSCGCTEVQVDSKALLPGRNATLTATVSPGENVQGLQRYSIAVTAKDPKISPFVLGISVEYAQLISVRPRRISLGLVPKMDLGRHITVELLRRGSGEASAITAVSTSAPWLIAKVLQNYRVDLFVDPSLPNGPFNEMLTIETDRGAINVPISGEGVGRFRLIPNPVVVGGQAKEASLRLVATEDGSCDLDKLRFVFDKSLLDVTEASGNGIGKEIRIRFLKQVDGIASYEINVVDPVSNDAVIANIIHGD